MTMFTHDLAIKSGINVPWSNMVNGIASSDDVSSLKESGLRIIFLGGTISSMVNPFLCEAHSLGMRGPRFVFFVPTGGFVASAVPAGCSASVILEQLRAAFSVSFGDSPPNSAPGFIGYSPSNHTALILKELGELPPAMVFPQIYHDAAIGVILALNMTEQRLKERYGSSLKNYSDFPGLVAEEVRQVMPSLNFNGIGGFVQAFSPEGRLIRPYVDLQVLTPSGMRSIARARPLIPDNYELSSFAHKLLSSINWPGMWPPRDKALLTVEVDSRSLAALISIWILAAGLTLSQVGLCFRIKHYRRFKSTGVVGCLLINLSAGLFISELQAQILAASIVASITGCSLVSDIICCRLFVIERHVRKHAESLSSRQQLPGSGVTVGCSYNRRAKSVIFPQNSWNRIELRSIRLAAIPTFLKFVIMLIWLGTQDLTCELEMTSVPRYDAITDEIIQRWAMFCRISNQSTPVTGALLGCIAIGMVILVITALVAIYDLKNAANLHGKIRELFPAALGALVVAALIPATIMIGLITVRDPVTQQLSMAFSLLVISASVSATWFVKQLRR